MQVYMLYRLSAIAPSVGDDAKSTRQPPLAESGGHMQQVTEQFGWHRGHIGKVLPRDYQQMRRRLRIEIVEGQCLLILKHSHHRDRPTRQLAKYAVDHGHILAINRSPADSA